MATLPQKGAEGHNFSGGDDNSTVLDFHSPPSAPLVMPPAAAAAGIVPEAAAAAHPQRIALEGGAVVKKTTKNKPIFVKHLFHRAFRHLDPHVKLGVRVESILGTTTFKFLRNLVTSIPKNSMDLHLLNGMMLSLFNLSSRNAHVWTREEDELLDAITDKGRKIMVHKIFLPAVLGGHKLGSRIISKHAIALPPRLVEQFKPDIFESRKHVTAEIFFKVAMIVLIVRFVQRIHAFLQLTGGHTISKELLQTLTLNGVFSTPLPSKEEQTKWVNDHPELIVTPTRTRRRSRTQSAPSVIVIRGAGGPKKRSRGAETNHVAKPKATKRRRKR